MVQASSSLIQASGFFQASDLVNLLHSLQEF
jgi:hypothetical protein